METTGIFEPEIITLHTEPDTTISDYELERGKPMPNEQHSLTQLNISVALRAKYKSKYTILPELSIVLGERTAVPDICVYPQYTINWLQDVPAAKVEPPLLVVEIVSPSQTLAQIRDKALEYFRFGVRSCWIVQPEIQTISVLHSGEKTRTFDSGLVEDSLTGISIIVEEVFE